MRDGTHDDVVPSLEQLIQSEPEGEVVPRASRSSRVDEERPETILLVHSSGTLAEREPGGSLGGVVVVGGNVEEAASVRLIFSSWTRRPVDRSRVAVRETDLGNRIEDVVTGEVGEQAVEAPRGHNPPEEGSELT